MNPISKGSRSMHADSKGHQATQVNSEGTQAIESVFTGKVAVLSAISVYVDVLMQAQSTFLMVTQVKHRMPVPWIHHTGPSKLSCISLIKVLSS